MATTFSDNYQIKLIGTGLEAGTWGSSTNENFKRIEQALGGSTTSFNIINPPGASTYTSDTLTWRVGDNYDSDESGSEGRNRFINFVNLTTTLSATQVVQIRGNATSDLVDRIYFVRNSLSQAVDMKFIVESTTAADVVSVPQNCSAVIYSNASADEVGNLLGTIMLEGINFPAASDIILKQTEASALEVKTSDRTMIDVTTDEELEDSSIMLAAGTLNLDIATIDTETQAVTWDLKDEEAHALKIWEKDVAAITTINKNLQAMVTAANTFTDGDSILIAGVSGMTQVNGNYYVVANSSSSAFKLKDTSGVYIDSTGFDTYTGPNDGTATQSQYYIRCDTQDGLKDLTLGDSDVVMRIDSTDVVLDPTGDSTNIATITTIDRATEATVTAANTFSDDDVVFITGVVGMTQVNDEYYIVDDRLAASFKLKNLSGSYINSSGFSAYVSNGTATDGSGQNFIGIPAGSVGAMNITGGNLGIAKEYMTFNTSTDRVELSSALYGKVRVPYGTMAAVRVESGLNVSPLRATSTDVSTPFAGTGSTSIVTVTDTAHGAASNDFVVFSQVPDDTLGVADTVWNRALGFQITVTDANNYTIDIGTIADSGSSAGGSNTDIAYLFPGTLTSRDVDIGGGTIDGTVIGGTKIAAISGDAITGIAITGTSITGSTSVSTPILNASGSYIVATITGIDEATEATVTATNTFNDGDSILIAGVVGMTEVNSNYYFVSDSSSSAFKLKDSSGYVNSTVFTTYVSGGTATSVIGYVNFDSTSGISGIGFRGNIGTVETKLTSSDAWGIPYHSGAVSGQGVYFQSAPTDIALSNYYSFLHGFVKSTSTLLADPFTGDTSNVVVVTDASHGVAVYDSVVFSDVSGTQLGIPAADWNRDTGYRILEIVNSNSYKIDVETAASSGAGGGSGISASYGAVPRVITPSLLCIASASAPDQGWIIGDEISLGWSAQSDGNRGAMCGANGTHVFMQTGSAVSTGGFIRGFEKGTSGSGGNAKELDRLEWKFILRAWK